MNDLHRGRLGECCGKAVSLGGCSDFDGLGNNWIFHATSCISPSLRFPNSRSQPGWFLTLGGAEQPARTVTCLVQACPLSWSFLDPNSDL